MAFERRFATGFAARVALLVVALALFAFALATPGLAAARIVAGLLVAGAIWRLWHHVDRTNREMARFVDALRHGDFAQDFSGSGRRFGALGRALTGAIHQLRDERARGTDAATLQAALAEESPAALLLVDADRRVTLANKAARKLFSRLPGTRVEDFAGYGAELVALLDDRGARERVVIPLRVDGVTQRAMASRAELARGGATRGVVAVQPIQQELSSVELAAQADLVRVLTHEIMNSMTPVVSLAESAARLMARIDHGGDPDLADAHAAIDTLARRSSGIMHFVDSYRAFSGTPVLHRRRFAATPWAEELRRLFAASRQGAGVALEIDVTPEDMLIDADPDLLAQIVLNLLKNGVEAAAGMATPRLTLTIAPLPGGRARITLADNGPGVPPHLAEEIFLPFFTTKADGTGVGLSLARRIMAAHGGALALVPCDRGACFELVV